MIDARDFFTAAPYDYDYEVLVGKVWHTGINPDHMLDALDRAGIMFEEQYAVSYFSPSIVEDHVIYVTIVEKRGCIDSEFGLESILAEMTED